MHKNKLLTCLVSLILCCVLVFNCNSFRRDTYAYAAVVVYGIEITAEAAAAIAGILYAYGLISTDPTENATVFTDFTGYDTGIDIDSLAEQETATKQAYVDKCNAKYNDIGLYYALDDNGTITCTAEDNRKVGIVEQWATKSDAATMEKVKTTLIDGADLIYDAGELVKTTSDGVQRVSAGIVAGVDALTSVGESFYDYLHSSDSVEYDAGFTGGTGTGKEIQLAYYTFQQEMAASYYGYVFDQDSRPLTYYSVNDSILSKYSHFKFYYNYYPDGSLYQYTDTLYFACLCYNSDGSYSVWCNSILRYLSDPSNISHHQSYSRASGTDMDADDVYNVKLNFGLNRCYQSLNDLTNVGYYINTDVLTDADVDAVTGAATLTVGDTAFNVADDNIYTKKEAVLTGIDDVASAADTAIVTVPAVDDSGEYVQPKTIASVDPTTKDVTYDDVQTVVNPDVIDDVSTDTTISDAAYQSENIFQLLYKFFNNFWTKLLQVLKSLFVVDAAFLPGWFDKFQAAFYAKGYNFDFDWLKSDTLKQIPDFYLKWGSQEFLFIPSEYIYACVDFVRSIIRAYIYFLVLLHDRERVIYLLRGTASKRILHDLGIDDI